MTFKSFFKKKRLEDKAWLVRVRSIPCILTNNPEGNDPAHIRYGFLCASDKPDDDLVLPLRHDMHVAQHNHRGGEIGFWREVMAHDDHFMMECVKAYARQLYRENNP